MSQQIIGSKAQPEQAFFLSEFIGAKVFWGKKRIGRLSDFIIVENGKLPVVTHIVVPRPFGDPTQTIPWDRIASLTTKEIAVNIENLDKYAGEPPDNVVLLKDQILDKKVLDTDGHEVDVVYDIRLVMRSGKLYVSDVDFSRYGLLRRLGLKRLADFIYRLAESIRDDTTSWTYVQPLSAPLGRFKGNIKLNVLKDKLADMHPVDVADILEELDHTERVALFEALEPGHASDTLEEISPSVQRDLVSSLKIEKVAQLINEMTPGQAADVLSVLPGAESDDILQLINKDDAAKVRSILEKQDEKIMDYATSDFFSFSPQTTVGQAQNVYRRMAKAKDVMMYFYIVDSQDRLVGVLDIRELFQADDNTPLKSIIVENPITLNADDTLLQASKLFARYGFRAIPIVDENSKILGVVTYRDVMQLKHQFVE
ncbi:MAG: CBS domain-containing protein [Candidatus Marsarchaeota archaeon]|nr:CBS domain-containing protein [Candidatus Marsarchaeota archaeon]